MKKFYGLIALPIFAVAGASSAIESEGQAVLTLSSAAAAPVCTVDFVGLATSFVNLDLDLSDDGTETPNAPLGSLSVSAGCNASYLKMSSPSSALFGGPGGDNFKLLAPADGTPDFPRVPIRVTAGATPFDGISSALLDSGFSAPRKFSTLVPVAGLDLGIALHKYIVNAGNGSLNYEGELTTTIVFEVGALTL